MRFVWFGGALAVLLGFVLGVPTSVSAGSGGSTVEASVLGLIRKHGFETGEVAVAILGDSGESLALIQAREPFKPASNQKLLTTAAALALLGPDHKYVTTLQAPGAIQNGRIDGDLLVRGTGDPNISSRFYEGGPGALFRAWARELRARGLQEVTGGIVADDTYFDDVRLPPTWDDRQAETWYSAQVSALSLNDNCLDVVVRPASRAGRPAEVGVVPASALIEIEGAPQTVAGGKAKVIVHRKPGTNRIQVKGQIGLGAPAWMGNITMDDPALVFASALANAMKAEGITIKGSARKLERRSSRAGVVPAVQAPAILVEHTSTLLQDLQVILKRSQNLHAEILLKAMGARAGGEGSLAGGERAIREYLKAKRIPADGLVVADGSGLSHANRVSAETLVRVLHSVRGESHFESFLQALPIAGEDGTLDDRFRGRAARGRIHAKTGYIRGVSCLSGYVLCGKRIASFAVLVNSKRGGIGAAKTLQEEIGDLIYHALER